MRARVYAPALGRFLQADPIGTDGGVNLYAYVENDPLNATVGRLH
jgi:RHS repeat-associated protein